MNYRDTLNVCGGQLFIGGARASKLAESFGTPLYVMDERYIRSVIRAFKNTVNENYGEGNISYASKAFCCGAIYAIAREEGICADVVSAGEIYTALKAGFEAENLFFHGNAKTDFELDFALKNGIGYIVIDNFDEIADVDRLAKKYSREQKVLIRCNPGVEAHTHKFIQTAAPDSKFGFSIANGDCLNAVKAIVSAKNIKFSGLHCHIGSQIFDKNAFVVAADIMTDFIVKLNEAGMECDVLDLGGGFGVYYSEGDPKYSVTDYCDYLKTIIHKLSDCVEKKKIKKPYVIFEPGRSVVAEAGITLYSVVGRKEIKGLKKYVAIDGGMGDNIRPALYEAKYEAVIADKADAAAVEIVDLAGKFCESSDILIKDLKLPKAEKGDVIAVFSTGAYNYSMASNYNRNPVPPVVLVCDGKAEFIVKPQTLDDIARNDVVPQRLIKGDKC